MLSPIADLKKRRTNATLHGRSVNRKTDVPGHNVFKGYSNPGTGDGVDLFGSAGEKVCAPFAGVVYSHGCDMQTKENLYLYRAADKKAGVAEAWTVLAHIDVVKGLNVGDSVTAGQVVGKLRGDLNDPHLHFELWLGGNALSATTSGKYKAALALLCGIK